MRELFLTRHRVAQCHFSPLVARGRKLHNRMARVHFWNSHPKAQSLRTALFKLPCCFRSTRKRLLLICRDCGMKPSSLCATRLKSFDVTVHRRFCSSQKLLCLSLPFVTSEICSAYRWTSQIAQRLATPSFQRHFCAHKTSPKGQEASKALPCTPVIMEILLWTCKTTTVGPVQEHALGVNSA